MYSPYLKRSFSDSRQYEKIINPLGAPTWRRHGRKQYELSRCRACILVRSINHLRHAYERYMCSRLFAQDLSAICHRLRRPRCFCRIHHCTH